MELIINLHLLYDKFYLFFIKVKLNDHKIKFWRLINY